MERLVRSRGFCGTAGALALAGGVLFAPAAADAAVCMQHKMLVSYLTERFDETPRALGLVASRNVMEVYVSEKGTWTIVMTTVQGVACIIAAGDTWEAVKVAMAEDPEY
jgi:hypothetical protein